MSSTWRLLRLLVERGSKDGARAHWNRVPLNEAFFEGPKQLLLLLFSVL